MSKSLNEQLHSAAASGDTAAVLRLISKGAKVNARGFFGRTPLINAAAYNRPETVKALLERGADASLTDDMGIPAAQAASKNGHVGVVDILRRHTLSLKKIKLAGSR
jgi:uncharacterized protein